MTLQIHRLGQKILTVPPGFAMEFFAPKATAAAYADKVLATQSANLIAYWPLWEASGAVADNYEGTAARDGAYTGVTLGQTGIGDGQTCPLFPGADAYVDIYTTSLRDAFNGAEGTLMAWFKVFNAGAWTDGNNRFVAQLHTTGAHDYIRLYKAPSNDLFRARYKAGDVEQVGDFSYSGTAFVQVGITWSKTADEVRIYLAGSQEGATLTGLGIWGDVPEANLTCLGAYSTSKILVWYGWLAHCALWTTPLMPTEMAGLATV